MLNKILVNGVDGSFGSLVAEKIFTVCRSDGFRL